MQKIVLFLFSLLIISAYAQLGEVAGPLNFNVSIGSSQTQQLVLINGGSTPITVKTTLNSITQIANTITPSVTFNPEVATIPPHSQLAINVTVAMPYNTSDISKHWEAIISAAEQSNITISGTGAVVVAGMAKIANITALPPRTNWLLIIGIVAVVATVAAIGAGSYYYFAVVKKKAAKAARLAAARKLRMAGAKAPARARKAKARARARKPARRAARRPARRTAARRTARRATRRTR